MPCGFCPTGGTSRAGAVPRVWTRPDTVSANAIALWAWRRRSDRHRGELVRALLELIEDGEGSGSGAVSWDSAKARAELEAPCVRARGPSAGLHDEREWF